MQHLKSASIVQDYRNCKLQRILTSDAPIALLLDRNYLLTIGNMQQRAQTFAGPVLTVFPDSSFYCGSLFHKEISGVNIYHVPDQYYIFLQIGEPIKLLMDLEASHNLLYLELSQTAFDQILSNPVDGSKPGMYPTTVEQTIYKSGQQRLQLICKYLTLSNQTPLDLKSFVEVHFGAVLQVTETMSCEKSVISITYPQQSSISLRLSSLKLQSLGYYNAHTSVYELLKRQQQSIVVEEAAVGSQPSSIQYKSQENRRPAEARKAVEKYLRQSMEFVNNYIELDYVYKIKHVFHSLERFMKLRQTEDGFFGVKMERIEDHREPISHAKEDIYRAIKKKTQKNREPRDSPEISVPRKQYHFPSKPYEAPTHIEPQRRKQSPQKKHFAYLQNYLEQEEGIERRSATPPLDSSSKKKLHSHRQQPMMQLYEQLERLSQKSEQKRRKERIEPKKSLQKGIPSFEMPPRAADLNELTKYYEIITSKLKSESGKRKRTVKGSPARKKAVFP